MKLEWMGEYRDIVEQLIKYCNVYAAVYKKEEFMGTDIPISYAQIQIIEYLLENEELHLNMKQLAAKLGITTSNFSKLVNKLESKGLLQKYHAANNRKEVIIQVTEYGKKVYADYSEYIYRNHFKQMFEAAKDIPKEYLPLFAGMWDNVVVAEECEGEEEIELVPIPPKN